MVRMNFEFVRFINQYLSEYIRLADTKAAVMLGTLGVLLGVLIGRLEGHQFGPDLPSLAIVLTVAALLVQATVIWPRTGFRRKEGLIFWENIASRDQDSYRQDVTSVGEARIMAELANQAHSLGCTADRKYRYLRWAVALAVLALLTDVWVLAR